MQLRAANLPMARLKTGTPPRLDGRTIDWAAVRAAKRHRSLDNVAADAAAPPSPALLRHHPDDRATHAIIRGGLDRSPLFGGAIAGPGPRYCPSIEDKIHRFGDRDGHQIFLEPEGLDDITIYPNGISTSLPADVQAAMIASIPGLKRADLARAMLSNMIISIPARSSRRLKCARSVVCSVRADQRHDRL